MRIGWSGLMFHAVILLWSFEVGQRIGRISELCTVGENLIPSRVVLISLPGLEENHIGVIRNIPGVLTEIRTPKSVLPHTAATAGVENPPLLPDVLDDIFHHANTTVFSGVLPVRMPSNWIKLPPPDYDKEGGRSGDRQTIERVKQLLLESTVDIGKEKRLKVESVIFYIRLIGLQKTQSFDSLRLTVKNIFELKQTLDVYYKDRNTTVVLWGETSGPLILWGDRIANSNTTFTASDLCVFISTLLRREVPADSKGILQINYLQNIKERATGLYCNSKQLFDMAVAVQGENSILSFWDRMDIKQIKKCFNESLTSLKENKFDEVIEKSVKLAVFSLKEFHRFVTVLGHWRLALVILTNFGYLAFLTTEMLEDVDQAKPAASLYIHLFFGLLSLCLISLPFLTPWPHIYHLYLQVPHAFWWVAVSRYSRWFPKLKNLTFRKISWLSVYAITLFIAAEVSLMDPKLSASVFICILSLLPVFPRFAKAPLLLTTSWFLINASILGTINFPNWQHPDTKAINFSATVWLCITGFSTFWVRPLKDRIICIIITILISFAMLLQNMALTYDGDKSFLQYISWPMLLSCFIPLFGQNNLLNRIIHCTSSTAVVLCLSSGRFEPLCFLIVMITVWLWTLMERYQMSDLIDFEAIRRSIFLFYLILLGNQLVRTMPEAYKPFQSEVWIHFIDFYRELVVSCTILTVFLSLMNSDSHSYNTFIMASIIFALCSTRTLLMPIDNSIHIRGVVMILSYYIALILQCKRKFKQPGLLNENQELDP